MIPIEWVLDELSADAMAPFSLLPNVNVGECVCECVCV